MSWLIVEHFVERNRGDFRAVKRFQDRLNDGATLEILSTEFHCSVAEVSRLRRVLFVQKFHLAEWTKKYLESKLAHSEAESEELVDYLLDNKRMEKGLIFKFDGGKKNTGRTP